MLQQNPHPFEIQMRLTQPTHQWPEIRVCPFELQQPLQFLHIISPTQSKIIKYTKKKENITHSQEKE